MITTEIRVADASVFSIDSGIRRSHKDDIGLCMLDADGKPTGWSADYRDGRWVASDGASARKSKKKSGSRRKSGEQESQQAQTPASRAS